MIPPVNYIAIIVAAIASYVLGFLWHGPLFGKQWMMLSGMTPEKMNEAKAKGMTKTFIAAFLTTLLMSYVIANIYDFASSYYNLYGYQMGLMVAFWSWLGFIVPVTLNTVFWENRTWKLWLFNVSFELVSIALMAVIIAVWA